MSGMATYIASILKAQDHVAILAGTACTRHAVRTSGERVLLASLAWPVPSQWLMLLFSFGISHHRVHSNRVYAANVGHYHRPRRRISSWASTLAVRDLCQRERTARPDLRSHVKSFRRLSDMRSSCTVRFKRYEECQSRAGGRLYDCATTVA